MPNLIDILGPENAPLKNAFTVSGHGSCSEPTPVCHRRLLGRTGWTPIYPAHSILRAPVVCLHNRLPRVPALCWVLGPQGPVKDAVHPVIR